MKKLDVYYSGWGEDLHLGTLAEGRAATVFEYSADALDRKLELSPFKYPLAARSYTFARRSPLPVPGFIHDCLPDGWGLLLMDRAVRDSGRDPATLTTLDRLAIIGDSAIGALRFAPPEDLKITRQDADLLALARAVRKIEAGNATGLLPLLQKVGSPQGARPKAALWYAPRTGEMSTREFAGADPWLVKFPARGEHPEVCALEALYARLATEAGVQVPETRFFPLRALKSTAFGAARFDRVGGLRAPIQSFAALMDVNFREAMIDYGDMLRLVMRLTRDRREVEQMFSRCVFNVVFNNRDDHLRNFAFRMQRDGEWKLSPAFDLTFSEGFGGQHWNSVMTKGAQITRDDLLSVAQMGGLKAAAAKRAISQVLDSLSSWSRLSKNLPMTRETRRKVHERVLANARRC